MVIKDVRVRIRIGCCSYGGWTALEVKYNIYRYKRCNRYRAIK
jgi:hypothetical protein